MNLLRGSVFGDRLGSLGNGMFRQFPGKEETDGGLDFSGRDSRLLVVLSQSGGLAGDALENAIHERVHDGHGLGADTSVGVHLLEDLVDVDSVRLTPLLPSLLISLGDGLLGLTGLLGSLS